MVVLKCVFIKTLNLSLHLRIGKGLYKLILAGDPFLLKSWKEDKGCFGTRVLIVYQLQAWTLLSRLSSTLSPQPLSANAKSPYLLLEIESARRQGCTMFYYFPC
jgi:hypothetical protein